MAHFLCGNYILTTHQIYFSSWIITKLPVSPCIQLMRVMSKNCETEVINSEPILYQYWCVGCLPKSNKRWKICMIWRETRIFCQKSRTKGILCVMCLFGKTLDSHISKLPTLLISFNKVVWTEIAYWKSLNFPGNKY